MSLLLSLALLLIAHLLSLHLKKHGLAPAFSQTNQFPKIRATGPLRPDLEAGAVEI